MTKPKSIHHPSLHPSIHLLEPLHATGAKKIICSDCAKLQCMPFPLSSTTYESWQDSIGTSCSTGEMHTEQNDINRSGLQNRRSMGIGKGTWVPWSTSKHLAIERSFPLNNLQYAIIPTGWLSFSKIFIQVAYHIFRHPYGRIIRQTHTHVGLRATTELHLPAPAAYVASALFSSECLDPKTPRA